MTIKRRKGTKKHCGGHTFCSTVIVVDKVDGWETMGKGSKPTEAKIEMNDR